MGWKIPCTDIPYRHFKAMLKKDIINWKRNYKRSIMEIVFPIIIFIIISCIRASISPMTKPFTKNVEKYSTILMPNPDSARLGIAT